MEKAMTIEAIEKAVEKVKLEESKEAEQQFKEKLRILSEAVAGCRRLLPFVRIPREAVLIDAEEYGFWRRVIFVLPSGAIIVLSYNGHTCEWSVHHNVEGCDCMCG